MENRKPTMFLEAANKPIYLQVFLGFYQKQREDYQGHTF